MNENWKLVYASSDRFDTRVVEAKLKDNNIENVFFNHQDSMNVYLNNAELEAGVYVHESDFEKAKQIIEEQ